MKLLHILFSIIFILLISCETESYCDCRDKDASIQEIKFQFTEANQLTVPAVVNFEAISKNAQSFKWDFGDFNSPDNIARTEKASHTFSKAGTYNVRLDVTGKTGGTNDNKSISIKVRDINEELRNSLVLNLPFDLNMNDQSIYKNNGIAQFNISYTSDRFGKVNSAIKFGGYDSPGRIRIPNSSSLRFSSSQGMTINLWYKSDDFAGMLPSGIRSNAGVGTLFAKDGDVTIINNRASAYIWGLVQNGSSSGVDLTCTAPKTNTPVFPFENSFTSIGYRFQGNYIGRWNNLIYVMGPKGSAIYINGVLLANNSTPVDFTFPNTKDLYFGSFLVQSGNRPYYPFNGAIDDITIYNRILTDEEIKYLTK